MMPRSASTIAVAAVVLLCSVIRAVYARVVFDGSVYLPPVQGREVIHRLILFDEDEPVDVLDNVRQKHGASRQWRQSILAQVCQQPKVRCTRDRPIVFRTRIHVDAEHSVGELTVLEDQEPVDALAVFAERHGLLRDQRRRILTAICERPQLECTRYRTLLFQQRITTDGAEKTLGTLEIYDDEEPADQVYRYVKDNELPVTAIDQLVQAVCGRVACERLEPMVFSKAVSTPDGTSLGHLDIPINHEPADIVYRFGLYYGLQKPFRQELLHTVCNDKYVTCERPAPYVFEAPIIGENNTNVGTLRIMEDQELADAVYRFAWENEITPQFQWALMQQLCGRDGILCTRGQALLRAIPISDGQGGTVGVLELYDGQEPADVAYQFAEQHGLSASVADHLVDVLCGLSKDNPPDPKALPVKCNRFYPVVYSVPVSATNGSRLGILEVLHNDEVADAVARFGNKYGLGKDEKGNLVQAICQASDLPCTRQEGLIYIGTYELPDGTRERLDFMDGVEPTDLIYTYGQMRNLTLQQRKKFLIEVCNEPRRRPNCTRAEPMLLTIPIWESADKKMGDLEILEGQDPVDMVYAFMEKHDLFQTAPLNTTLREVVCNSTRVTCTRDRPRRILFSMQATYHNIQHTLQYVQQESDWICQSLPHGGKKCVHYVEILSKEFCTTHMPDWTGCEARILEALRSQLEAYEERMWRGKDLYAKLGLVKVATKDEIDAAYNRLVKRFNNETEPHKYEKLKEAYATLSDPEDKYYYDLPCVKLFGCLCGKKKKDGSLTFTPD